MDILTLAAAIAYYKKNSSAAVTAAQTAAAEAESMLSDAEAAIAAALSYSGGYVYLTDARTDKQYSMGFLITEDGEPAISLTEIEED